MTSCKGFAVPAGLHTEVSIFFFSLPPLTVNPGFSIHFFSTQDSVPRIQRVLYGVRNLQCPKFTVIECSLLSFRHHVKPFTNIE